MKRNPCRQKQTVEEKPEERRAEALFTPAERALIEALLSGEDYEAALRPFGAMASITADSVNEKLFDRLSDTAIADGGEGLEIIEDYREDLKGMLEHGE